MTFELITNKENWNPKNLDVFVPFTQEWFYFLWQDNSQKEIFHIKGTKEGKEILYAQVLKSKIISGKSYFYCPYGPIISNGISEEDKKSFISFISSLAKKHNSIFVRLDNNIFGLPHMKYANNFQPPAERVINISEDMEIVLKNMDKNLRYSINLAKKSGVAVSIIDTNLVEHLDEFYEALSLSAERNDIGLHPKSYYKKIMEIGEDYKNVFLTFTRHEGKILVASLTVLSGNRATQVFSGSTDFYRKLRPAAITRFESMTYAKKRGMMEFSLGGVISEKNYVKDWFGISEFKKQFGGNIVDSANPGVLVLSLGWFALYNLKKIFR